MSFPIYPSNHPLPFAAARAWLGHVEAGRRGSRPVQSAALKARHARNELVVLGDRLG